MSTSPIVKPTERWRGILAWTPLALTVAIWLPEGWLSSTVCLPVGADVSTAWAWLNILFSSIAFAALCGLIITRQPQNRIGWLCGAIGVLPPLLNASFGVQQCANEGLFTGPGVAYAAWFSSFFGLVLSLQFLLLPLWFPDGRFQSAGWRRFALIAYGLLVLGAIVSALWPGKLILAEAIGGVPTGSVNPFGLPFEPSAEQTRLVQAFLSISLLIGILIGNFSLFFRWRNADLQTRQQIKVFAFFLITIGTTYFLFELVAQLMLPAFNLFGVLGGWLYMALLMLLWVGYPVAIGVAVLRYRMYDVDVVIRKTVTYSIVVALLLLVYFGSVILLQQLFANITGQRSEWITIVSTLVIAALFVPLRNRIQNSVDKRFYRKKYDAQKVLQEFAMTVRDETDLDKLTGELLSVVNETMQPKNASVWLKADHRQQTTDNSQRMTEKML